METVQDIKVSIIVPIYNSEKYLGYCLNSIVSQTYYNIEIILVNDGSTDGSINICENYANLDSRISIINSTNCGVSHARNLGISYAKGKYILFVDSDDIIASKMVETLVTSIEMYNAEIAFCGMKIIKEKSRGEIRVVDEFNSSMIGKECVLGEKEFCENFPYLLLHTVILEGPCNRLYKSDILKNNNLLFQEDVSLGEDFIFNLKYYSHCKKYIFLSESYYYYRQHNGETLTNKYRPDMLANRIYLLEHYNDFMTQKNAWTKAGRRHFASYVTGYVISILKNIFATESDKNIDEKKCEIDAVLNCSLFRKNIYKAGWIDENWLWLKECFKYCDVGTTYEKAMKVCQELSVHEQDGSEKTESRNQGQINKLLVAIIGKLNLFIHNETLDKVKRNIEKYGIKCTIYKIKRRFI